MWRNVAGISSCSFDQVAPTQCDPLDTLDIGNDEITSCADEIEESVEKKAVEKCGTFVLEHLIFENQNSATRLFIASLGVKHNGTENGDTGHLDSVAGHLDRFDDTNTAISTELLSSPYVSSEEVPFVEHKESQKKRIVIKSLKVASYFASNMAHKEVENHLRVSGHPNIVSLWRVIKEDKHYIHMLMPLVGCKNLYDFMYDYFESETSMLPFDIIKTCTLQIAKAIQHCHSHFVIHRDVKLENVIIAGHDSSSFALTNGKRVNLKLCDFGWSLYCDPNRYPQMVVCSTEAFGTRIYLSPEVYNRRGYCAKVDTWALGMVMLEMISGCFKFQPKANVEGNIYDNLTRGKTKQLQSFLSRNTLLDQHGVCNVVFALLEPVPQQRMNITQVVQYFE